LKIKWNDAGAEVYFKCMWILAAGLYILIPSESRILNLVYYGIHAIHLVAFFLALMALFTSERPHMFDQRRIFLLFGLAIVLLFSFMTTEETISFGIHITGALGFLEMLLAVYLIDKVPRSAANELFVFKVNLVIAMVFIILSRTSYAYSGRIVGSLYLGYANPNATAIYLLMNMVLLLLYVVKIKRVSLRVLVYIICAYLTYLIYETDSRTCLFAAGVVVLWSVLAPQKRLSRKLVPIFLLIPLGFLFIYTAMYKSGQYAGLTILGKPFFSGREGFFVEKLNALGGYWLVGDVGKNPFTNMHNGPLTLLSSCGVLGYAIYLRYTGATLLQYYKNNVTKEQTVALIVIFAIFVHSCSEAALIVGGANYTIVTATFYWLLKRGGSESGEIDGG